MSEKKKEQVYDGADGIELRQCPNDGMPVLLLHGAGASSSTFTIPGPDIHGRPRCLRDWLWERGFEPWLLDWCGSFKVVKEKMEKEGADLLLKDFHLDKAATEDIPWALKTIREIRGDVEIGAVGHCLGAGALAQAIASGSVVGEEKPRLTHVVLLTLGLFYVSPVFWGVLKAEDRPLERLIRDPNNKVGALDPSGKNPPWPEEIERIYQGPLPKPHPPKKDQSEVLEMCNRLSFLYGLPYREEKLVPEIHHDTHTVVFHGGRCRPRSGWVIEGATTGARGTLRDLEEEGSWRDSKASGVMWLTEAIGRFQQGEKLMGSAPGSEAKRFVAYSKKAIFAEAELPRQFGPIPLSMYVQAARNVLRGQGGVPKGLAGQFSDSLNGLGLVDENSLASFRGLTTTLITGKKNQLWHRKSVYNMCEWLSRDPQIPERARRRWVLPDYGHQDLLWGKSAREEVFPKIREGLRR
jgi:hypothetical protein